MCISLTSLGAAPDFFFLTQDAKRESVKAEPTPTHLIYSENYNQQREQLFCVFWQILFIPVEELCGESNFSQTISHEESEREEVSVKA